ncbi:MAG TPA: twin-arginine translocase TatA/TatE family subunit [Verrucomicrobiae bacterium]|nr:twin-arginine translocase TatA/TatE family subunit [Verrucomicrobiae bacterium]
MNAMLAILGLGTGELILVLVAVLVLFGAKRIPEFAKGLGKGINEFKKASREVVDSIEAEQQHGTIAPAVSKAPPANTAAQSTPPPETKVV